MLYLYLPSSVSSAGDTEYTISSGIVSVVYSLPVLSLTNDLICVDCFKNLRQRFNPSWF